MNQSNTVYKNHRDNLSMHRKRVLYFLIINGEWGREKDLTRDSNAFSDSDWFK